MGKEKQKKDWSPLGSLIRFQIRLFYDAARDFILSPLSFFVVVLDIIMGNKIKKESLFYKLMLMGRGSDKWINLFEQNEDEEEQGSIKKQQVQKLETQEVEIASKEKLEINKEVSLNPVKEEIEVQKVIEK